MLANIQDESALLLLVVLKSLCNNPLHLSTSKGSLKCTPKAWFPPMRLTYSLVYSHENKYNSTFATALNNLKLLLKSTYQK